VALTADEKAHEGDDDDDDAPTLVLLRIKLLPK